AGADFIFAEAVSELSQYQKFAEITKAPILANITEFVSTPIWSVQELQENGVQIVLYPLSAFRAANKAAQNVFETIRRNGSQADAIPYMQTRTELYDSIGYYAYENKLDELF